MDVKTFATLLSKELVDRGIPGEIAVKHAVSLVRTFDEEDLREISSYTSFFRGCSKSRVFSGSTIFLAIRRARIADRPIAKTAIRIMGHSIPIISDFEKILGVKTVLMGFGLESDAIHSPNENFRLDIFRKGIEAVVEFHKNYKG